MIIVWGARTLSGGAQPDETCLFRCEGRLERLEIVVFPEGPFMTARFSQARISLQIRGKHSQAAVDAGKVAIDHHEAGLRPPQTPPNHHSATY